MHDTGDSESPAMTHISNQEDALDLEVIETDIREGAKAMEWLIEHKTDNWSHWSIFIKGFRSFRNLVFAKRQTHDIKAHAYRQKLGELIELKKYSAYDIDKQDRSDCYALMDRIEDIDLWYFKLPAHEQKRWNHPNSIKKHCPKYLLSAGTGHNKPPKIKKAKKPVTNAEIERLKALLIEVIRRLAKYEPDALDLLKQVTPQDPNDSLEGILDEADTCDVFDEADTCGGDTESDHED
jgi:hypothetical protein